MKTTTVYPTSVPEYVLAPQPGDRIRLHSWQVGQFFEVSEIDDRYVRGEAFTRDGTSLGSWTQNPNRAWTRA